MQAQQTRDYLKSVKQDQLMLPDGPLLLSPESLIKAFHRCVTHLSPKRDENEISLYIITTC